MKTVFSFEVFPPKPTSPEKTVRDTLAQLKELAPDFISVTYGACGKSDGEKTLDIASEVKHVHGIESAAHLPCIGRTKEDVLRFLAGAKQTGIDNILALRGDMPCGSADADGNGMPCGDFVHASDLISFIAEHSDFNIIAACYPEGHIESRSIVDDIKYLRQKTDAGASHLITQLFLDNSYFYAFRERAAIAGINAPIEAGIMPVTNKKQIERMVSMCGVTLPKKFVAMITRYEHNPEALRDAGIAYAVDQIADLVTQGADGIHLYTMNNPYTARKIHEAVHRLFSAESIS